MLSEDNQLCVIINFIIIEDKGRHLFLNLRELFS
jgi:hypothetical protein